MEGERFDGMVRWLARNRDRRRAVAALLGGAIVGGGGLLARAQRPVAAQDAGTADAQCEAGPVIDNQRCRVNTCRNRADCACVRTAGGEKRCVEFLFEESFCKRRQCRSNRGCPKGELCVEIGGCCEGRRKQRICVSPCG